MKSGKVRKGGREEDNSMRALVTIVTSILLVAAGVKLAFAGQNPGTGVIFSEHDINFAGGQIYQKDDLQRVCVFCHTPHNALPGNTVPAPLWNHALSNQALEPYKWSAPLNSIIAFNSDPLIGPSRLCMSCHDGLTAVDAHGAAHPNNGTRRMTAAVSDPVLGVREKRYIEDLTVTHPIGFNYSDAVDARNANGLTELATTDQFFISAIPQDFNTHTRMGAIFSNKRIGDVLYSGYFTCVSCHDVHNATNVAGAPSLSNGTVANYFLRAPQQQSILCLSCHLK
jgi:hypothetical protein